MSITTILQNQLVSAKSKNIEFILKLVYKNKQEKTINSADIKKICRSADGKTLVTCLTDELAIKPTELATFELQRINSTKSHEKEQINDN